MLLIVAQSAFGGTYYIDFAGGSDGANGTSKATAWKRNPRMRGFSGTHTPAAGDRFIHKGGVTWPNNCFSMNLFGDGGAAGNPDYYGVDQTWYTGASWTRPKWSAEGQQLNGGNGFEVMVLGQGNYVTFDGIEFTSLFWTGPKPDNWVVYIKVDTALFSTVTNCKFTNWTHGTFASGTRNVLICIRGTTGSPYNTGSIIRNCEFDGSLTNNSGFGIYGGGFGIIDNYFHHIATGLNAGQLIVGNHISNVPHTFVSDGSDHTNAVYSFGPVVTIPALVIGNHIHDVTDAEVMFMQSGPHYYFNNVFYNVPAGKGVAVATQTSTGGAHHFYGNTFVTAGTNAIGGLGTQAGALGAIVIKNNLVVSNVGVYNSSLPSSPAAVVSNNQLFNVAQAASAGYSASNGYRPPSNPPVSGINYASIINALPNTLNSIDVTEFKARALKDFDGNPRTVWTPGAYEWGGTAPDPTVTPTPVPTPHMTVSSTAPMTFGSAVIGATPPDQTRTVTNDGAAGTTLTWSASGLASPWAFIGSPDTTLAKDEVATVTVRWRPTAMANDADTVILSDGTNTQAFDVGGICYPNLGTVSPTLTVDANDAIITAPFVDHSGDVWQTTSSETDPSQGGRLSFGITIPTTGEYKISGVVSAPNTGADSFYLNVDGEPTSPTMIADIQTLTSGASFASRDFPWRGNGAFNAPQFNPKVWTLSAGDHEVVIRGREPLAKLRTIKIEPLSTPPPALQLAFSASPQGGTAPLGVTFTTTASGGVVPITTAYDYDDGTTGSSSSHTYSAAGTYQPTVTITDSYAPAQTKSASATIVVDALTPLSVVAGATPASGAATLSVSFTATPTGGQGEKTYLWTFGDGTTSTSQNPSHDYTVAGDYTATVTIADSATPAHTDSDSISVTVTGSPPLTVSFTTTPSSGTVPFVVAFDSTVSGGTGPYALQWSFGDNGSPSSVADPSRTYTTAGTFSASLTATDSLGATQTVNRTIQANPPAPSMSAAIFASSATGVIPFTVGFSPVVTGGTQPYSYSWGFGDDSAVSTEAAPVHVYTAVQQFMVSLTVTDANGLTASASGHVATSLAPNPTSYINLK